MDIKSINWKEELLKMFPETTERKLEDNHKWCESCNGIGFTREGKYISFCNKCRGLGQIELCKNKCGKEKYIYSSLCEECYDKNNKEKLAEKEQSRYGKATKIHYKNYEGKFLFNERVMDKEELEEYLYDQISENDIYPEYIYGTIKEAVLSLDLANIIRNECCDNGYEDMDDYIDYKGIDEIQQSIDKWIKKQGDNNYIYYEDYTVVVLLDDLIKEIQEEIKKESLK